MPKEDGYSNLIPVTQKSKEEARQLSSNGGKASGVARRQKRLLKDIALEMLSNTKIVPEDLRKKLQDAGLPCDAGGAILLAQLAKASRGDTRAAEYVRDTAGQMPVRTVEVAVPQSDSEMQSLSDDDLKRLAD